MSQVNAGTIRRDLLQMSVARRSPGFPRDLVEISIKAIELFLNDRLPLGEGSTQSSQEYFETLSSTVCRHVMVKRNMDKIHYALTHLELILNGLTRGIDFSILDKGHGEQAGAPVCFYPSTDALGLVMPSNSPAVNSLWLPSIALKTPIVMKPGRDEPWTPFRLIQAFIAAGCPKEAFGFYPTDHEAADILRLWKGIDFRGQEHHRSVCGIGCSGSNRFRQDTIGDDMIESGWVIDVMASLISDNEAEAA